MYLVSIRRSTPHDIKLTSLIDVAFHVPVRVFVPGFVFLDASRFNLFETPLRKIHISGTKPAVEVDVP